MSSELQSIFGDRLRPSDVLPMLRRSWNLVVGAVIVCLVAAALVSIFSKREYRATATIRIVPSQGQEVSTKDVFDLDVRGFQEIERFYRTQMQLFKSRSFAERVAEEHRLRTGEEVSPSRLIGMVQVFPIERSQLVQVSITDTDPKRAAELANTVAQTFVSENIAWRRDMARDANTWVEERIADVEVRREIEVQRLLAFKAKNDIIDRDEASLLGALGSRLDALERSYGEVSAQRVLLESRLESYDKLLRAGNFDDLAAQSELPLSEHVRDLYASTKAAAAAAEARYGPRHPELQQARLSLEQVEQQIASEVRVAVGALRSQLAQLREQEQSLWRERGETKDSVLQQQRVAAEYRELQRTVAQIEETHGALLKRRDELELLAETRLNNARAVDAARVPTSFIRPRITLTMLAGLVLGIVFGLALALLRGLLDETIRAPEDVESFMRIPLLGVIPRIDAKAIEHPETLPFVQPRAMSAEAMRGVRTMVEHTEEGDLARRILVSSSVSSEGKTSVAVQLGIVFAQQGRRVVLVEGDHRRPRLHTVFDLPLSTPGIAEVVAQERALADVLRPTMIPGVTFLPRGKVRHAGVDLLSVELMADLLEQLEEHADLIIIDTPPSAALSDAITLARVVDSVVLVARCERVNRSLLRHVVRRFESVNAGPRGIVLNDFQGDRYRGKYYYYNQQGYYYRSDDDDGEGEAA